MRGAWAAWGLAAAAPGAALADPPELHATFNLDLVAVEGAAPVELDKLIVRADADLAPGLHVHASLLNSSGGEANARAGTLQGVDNIEVLRPRVRLFDAWVEKDLGRGANVRAGMQDYNEEFYATDSTDLLLSPTFGIGAEAGASGVNGPSIYPSSALAVRLKLQPSSSTYALVGVFNAKAGSLGDPDGIDTRFRQGVLAAGEVGWTGHGRIALGGWRYSRRQALIPPGPDPDATAVSQGAYLLVEEPIGAAKSPLTAFLRAGVAEARSLPISGALEAGLHLAPATPGRLHSELAVALAVARATARVRANVVTNGGRPADVETLVEITYSDRVAPHLHLQPDLQLIRNAGARRGRGEAVFTLRLTVDY